MGAGAGFNALASAGVQAGLDKVQRKRDVHDEDRRQKASDLIGTRNSILSKMPTMLGPNGEKTPEYDASFQQLSQAQQELGQLYHPDKAPGALQKDWHFLLGKMHGIASPKDNTPASTTSQTPEATLNTPASPITTPALPADSGVGQEAVAATTMPGMNSTPKGATPTMAVAKPKGLVEAGTIPIWNRPSVLNDDGTHSSELSISMGDDKGNQVLIPLIVDGKFLTPDGKMPPGSIPHNAQEWEKASPEWKALKMRAWQNYEKTGQHLGKFGGETAEDDVDAYAQVLHNRRSAGNQTTLPAGPSTTVTKAPPVPWGQAQVLKQKAASMQKAQGEANLLAAAAPLSPEQEAMAQFRTKDATRQVEIDASLRLAEKLGITGPALDEFKQQLAGIKNTTIKPLTGAAGQPYKGEDGLYYQSVSNPDGTIGRRAMNPDWKPNTKPVRGNIVNTKEHGWIMPWLDPYNPNRVIGYQKVTPPRGLQGTSRSGSTTDAYGVTTSSSSSTNPTDASPQEFNFSGLQELPQNYNGEEISGGQSPAAGVPAPSSATATQAPSGSPNKTPVASPAPPRSVAKPATSGIVPPVRPKVGVTPAQLKNQVPAPPSPSGQTETGQYKQDADGHIPDTDIHKYGFNPNLAQIANNLLDGTDTSKVPPKIRGAAEELAKKYGYGGQGMFTPRETLQIKEGASFLNEMANSPALKVLDNGFFANLPITGSSPDPTKEGFFGRLSTNLAARSQTPQQQKFMALYRQLDAMAIGLRSLVQSGRGTQKQTDLLISELPNPINTPSSEDAKRRLKLVQQELDIAAKTGHLRGFEDMQKTFNSASPQQHKKGDWVMYNGNKVQIKEINPDGTFDY